MQRNEDALLFEIVSRGHYAVASAVPRFDGVIRAGGAAIVILDRDANRSFVIPQH